MQLDLFEKDSVKLLIEELSKVKQSCDNVRRGLFARHNELAKLYLALREDFESFKSSLGYKNKSTEILEFFQEKVS